ncbi:hypothetical protein ABW54_13655 [Burkholderia cenocepacia]|nr:hypothetical protein ABW54_13655 [Burkholderia cenocepacia]
MHRQRLRRLMDFMLFIRYPFVPVPKPIRSGLPVLARRVGNASQAQRRGRVVFDRPERRLTGR